MNKKITKNNGKVYYDNEELRQQLCQDGRTIYLDVNSKIRYTDLPSDLATDMAKNSSKNSPRKLEAEGAELLAEFGLLDDKSAQLLAGVALKGGSPAVSAIRTLHQLSAKNRLPGSDENINVPIGSICPICGNLNVPLSQEALDALIGAVQDARKRRQAEIDAAVAEALAEDAENDHG